MHGCTLYAYGLHVVMYGLSLPDHALHLDLPLFFCQQSLHLDVTTYSPYVMYMTLRVTGHDLYGRYHTVQGVEIFSVDQQHPHLHQGALILFGCLLDSLLQHIHRSDGRISLALLQTARVFGTPRLSRQQA